MSPAVNKVLFGITDIFFIGRVEAALRGAPAIEAVWARPGDSLLSLYEQHSPSVVVLDLQDAVLDTIDGAARIRASAPADSPAVQVIGFYPHIRMDIRAAAEAAGVQRILPRSAFTKLLPQILAEIASRTAEV